MVPSRGNIYGHLPYPRSMFTFPCGILDWNAVWNLDLVLAFKISQKPWLVTSGCASESCTEMCKRGLWVCAFAWAGLMSCATLLSSTSQSGNCYHGWCTLICRQTATQRITRDTTALDLLCFVACKDWSELQIRRSVNQAEEKKYFCDALVCAQELQSPMHFQPFIEQDK